MSVLTYSDYDSASLKLLKLVLFGVVCNRFVLSIVLLGVDGFAYTYADAFLVIYMRACD